MPVRHTYINASDQPAQYAADECNRQAMSVREIYADSRLVDFSMWTYDVEAAEDGMDPWRSIGGIDKYADGRAPHENRPFILENDSGTRNIEVSGDYVVFMQKKDLTALGISIPESAFNAWKRAHSNPEKSKRAARTKPEMVKVRFLPAYHMSALKAYLSRGLAEQIEKRESFVARIEKHGLEWALDGSDNVFETAIRLTLFDGYMKIVERAEAGEPINWNHVIEAAQQEARTYATNSSSSTSVTSNIMDRIRCYVHNEFVSPRGGLTLIAELAASMARVNAPTEVSVDYAAGLIARGDAEPVEDTEE